MNKILITSFVVSLFLISFASADIIEPGTKTIPVINTITNMNNYPDYDFYSYSTLGGKEFSMCGPVSIYKIKSDGIVGGAGYKFCTVAVYAVKKGISFTNETANSSDAIKVLDHLTSQKVVAETSTQDKVENLFQVNLTNPNNNGTTKITRNSLIYLYVGIPIVAVLILGIILIRRKR